MLKICMKLKKATKSAHKPFEIIYCVIKKIEMHFFYLCHIQSRFVEQLKDKGKKCTLLQMLK